MLWNGWGDKVLFKDNWSVQRKRAQKARADFLNAVKGPFLAVLGGSSVKGNRVQALKDLILNVTDLDDGFLADLLAREDRDWANNFQVFKSEGITEESKEQGTLDLVRTVKGA